LPADSTFTRDVSHYFTLVYRAKDIPEVHGQKLDPPKLLATMTVPYLPGWQISGFSFKKSGSVHGLNIVASKMKKPFGCYIYGVGYSEGYMHPAGYISSPINGACTRTMASMVPGDLIDNDCDKKIDEEFSDSKDDDNDTIIDEDLLDMSEDEWIQTLIKYSKEDSLRGVVHGSWGEWTEWQCLGMCPNRTMVRSRQCNKPTPANGGRPCDGVDKEGKDGTCYMGQTCPEACPDYTWDLNCVGDCLKCKDPCNKLTGICDSCASGYKSPDTGCNIPCGFNEYGFNCMGNCTEKCGKDCYERENGTCSALAHGQWGQWSRWLCTQDCKDSRQVRKRECDNPKPSEHGNPCPESNIEYRDFICYKSLVCPQDCPPFRWHFNCTGNCGGCVDDCNKFNGSCTICHSHYKNPERACMDGTKIHCVESFFLGYICFSVRG
ncbi:properdin, partial [Biomphalaria pfeifferi]